MKTFCVSYDLVGDNRDYDAIEEMLEELGGERIQKSVWSLKLDNSWTCKTIKEYVKGYFKRNDRLFIALVENRNRDDKDHYVLINRYKSSA